MSKEEKERDEFFEYLLALNSVDVGRGFIPDRNGLAISKPKNPDTGIRNPNESSEMEDRLEELEEEVKGLSNFVNVLQRGPKGDRGEDGADFDLTEEDIKNAVKEGVIEGIKEFLSEKI